MIERHANMPCKVVAVIGGEHALHRRLRTGTCRDTRGARNQPETTTYSATEKGAQSGWLGRKGGITQRYAGGLLACSVAVGLT